MSFAKLFATSSVLIIALTSHAFSQQQPNPFAQPVGPAAPSVDNQRYPTLPPAPPTATQQNYDEANPSARKYREQMEDLSQSIEILRLKSVIAELNKKIADLNPPPAIVAPPPAVVAPVASVPITPVMAKPSQPQDRALPTILALRGSGKRVTATLRMPDGSERAVQKGARIDADTSVVEISDTGVEVLRKGVRRTLEVDASSAFGAGAFSSSPLATAATPPVNLPIAITPPAMMQK